LRRSASSIGSTLAGIRPFSKGLADLACPADFLDEHVAVAAFQRTHNPFLRFPVTGCVSDPAGVATNATVRVEGEADDRGARSIGALRNEREGVAAAEPGVGRGCFDTFVGLSEQSYL
jgi:hypothetical protein